MKRCPEVDLLKRFIDGGLNSDDFAEVDEHVDSCDGCQLQLSGLVRNELGSTDQAVHQPSSAALPDLPTGLITRLSERLAENSRSAKPAAGSNHALADVEQQADEVLVRLGDYQITREIGRGGMGVVYEAQQLTLGRQVALKVLPLGLIQDAESSKRFQQEAAAAASLHHTNIVPVHEAGQDNGTCFYTMQLIDGESLCRVIRDLRSNRKTESAGFKGKFPKRIRNEKDSFVLPDKVSSSPSKLAEQSFSPNAEADTVVGLQIGSTLTASGTSSADRSFFRDVATIGRQVADALQHAHQRGIVHRDIKPSNIMLDQNGIPWITDFGLAKTADGNLTRDGDVVGTLRYMSPERFDGDCDARGDVYSLGVTLYELLTLESPFAVREQLQLIAAIKDERPKPMRSINDRIPRDLETIVEKAMEKDPRRRYHTAAAMAEDLERFLNGLPIRARHVGAVERLWLWSKSNVGLAVAMAAVVIALILGTVVSTQQAVRARVAEKLATAEADRATIAEAVAMKEGETAQEMLAKSRCDLAEKEFERGKFVESQKIINEIPERFRDANWRFLRDHASDISNHIVFHQKGGVRDLRFLPQDNRFVAMAKSISVVDLGGKRIGRSSRAAGPHDARFGMDGEGHKIAFPIEDNDVAVMDVSTGKIIHRWQCDLESVDYVILSPDGMTAIAKDKNKLVAYAVETGKPLWEHANPNVVPGFSPDSQTVAVRGSGELYELEIQLLETGSGKVQRSFKMPVDTPKKTKFQFLPVLGQLACYGSDEIVVCSAKDGTRHRTLHFQDEKVMAISPRGSWIATTKGNSIRLWGMRTGRLVRSLNGSATPAIAIAFSTDNKTLVSSHRGSNDSIVNVWPTRLTETVAGISVFTGSKRTGVAFDSSGSRVYFNSGGRFVCLSIARNKIEWQRNARGAVHDDFVLHPRDGTLVLRLSKEGTMTHVTSSGETLPAFGRVFYSSVAFDRRGERLLAVATAFVDRDAGKGLKILSYPDGEDLQKIDEQLRPLATFCQDDNVVATAALAGGINLWDWKAGTRIRQIDASETGSINCLAASPDGSQLATGGPDRWIRVWDSATGKIQTGFRAHWEAIRCLKFSPDGREIISGSDLGVVRIHDAETGKEKLALYGLYSPAGGVAFSPDGKRIAAICKEGNLKVWGREISRRAAEAF